MAKQATAPLSKDFWTQKMIEHEKNKQEQKLKMKIRFLNVFAFNGSFDEFENAVEKCVEDMHAIPEEIFYEPLQLAAGSKYDSDKKVHYLLDNYISNVNLEMQGQEASMTLLGWALLNKKSELVKLLLEKGADPNEVAFKHNETGVSYTAVGLVLNDCYQYYVSSYGVRSILKYIGVITAPTVDENQVELLVKYGAKVSQAAIICDNEAALIPSEYPLIAQLPCVKQALTIELGKKVSDNQETSEEEEGGRIQIVENDTDASVDNIKVQQNTATPREGAEQEREEVDGAFGPSEKPAPTEQPKASLFSKVFSFSWLNFWSSKSGDMQNANTTSAVGVETKNEVPEPDSVDQLRQTPQPKTSWWNPFSWITSGWFGKGATAENQEHGSIAEDPPFVAVEGVDDSHILVENEPGAEGDNKLHSHIITTIAFTPPSPLSIINWYVSKPDNEIVFPNPHQDNKSLTGAE